MVVRAVALPFFAYASVLVAFSLPPSSLLVLAALFIGLLIVVISPVAFAAALYWRKRKGSRETLSLVGRTASVEEPLSPEGSVLVGGELWRALSASGVHVARGRANVRVVGARGHLLVVVESDNTDAPG